MENGIDAIKLATGKSTSITLKGLATAGFEWNYTSDNKNCIKVTRKFSISEKPGQKNIGASADEIFTITGLKKGTVNIRFFQQRGWEKNSDPINEKKVKIIVE